MLKEEISACNGIIVGKPKDEKYFHEYVTIIRRMVSKPVVFNLNFGHTAPMYTIPYGGQATLSYPDKKITITK